MIRFKAIKPKPFNDREVSKTVRDWMESWGDEVAIKEFDHVTDGWDGERPEWKQVYQAGATFISNKIELSDPESQGAKKWIWLDKGVAPHDIYPKDPKKPLVFMSKYFPGSRPGSLTTTGKVVSGDIIFAPHVSHPGVEARGWSEMLIEVLEDSYVRYAQEAFYEAARASGHGKE
jgi:hypothetical protein